MNLHQHWNSRILASLQLHNFHATRNVLVPNQMPQKKEAPSPAQPQGSSWHFQSIEMRTMQLHRGSKQNHMDFPPPIKNDKNKNKKPLCNVNMCCNKNNEAVKTKPKIRFTLGTAPGWILLRTLQRIIPLRSPSLNSSSEGSAGKSLAATTPTIFLSHPAASFLLDAAKHRLAHLALQTR